MSRLSLDVILQSLFSHDLIEIYGSDESPFHKLFLTEKRDLRFAMNFRALHKIVKEILSYRVATIHWPFDILTILHQSRNQNGKEVMNESELIDEIMTLIVAGHETTASALTWCWYCLALNPDIQNNLYHDVNMSLTNHDSASCIRRMSEINSLQNVVNETLRLYPPGWLISRKAREKDQLGQYILENNADVLISLYALHRRSDLWKQPERFVPDRFTVKSNFSNFAFVPFSKGPRQCIGDRLALLEMKIHLYLIIQKFNLKMINPKYRVKLQPQINLKPEGNIYLKINKR